MEIIWWIMIGVGAGVASLVGLYGLRQWIRGRRFQEQVNAYGKVVLITGANSGVGRQLSMELNKRGAKVYMLCRSVQRGNEAAKELIEKFNNNLCLDEKKVDILFCNAGVMWLPKFELTEDGHEATLQANHLGHFLLAELLMPKLEAAPSARIVATSSELHRFADSCSIDRMNNKAEFGAFQSYSRSKLATVLYATEFTRRLRKHNPNTKITINSLHPGVINTNLIRSPIYTKFLKYPLYPFSYYFLKTESDGCQCSLFVALSSTLDGVSGKYFDNSAIGKPHKLADNAQLCRDFYDECTRAVKLDSTQLN